MKLWTIPDEIDFYKMGRDDYIVKVYTKSQNTLCDHSYVFKQGMFVVTVAFIDSYSNNQKCLNCYITMTKYKPHHLYHVKWKHPVIPFLFTSCSTPS